MALSIAMGKTIWDVSPGSSVWMGAGVVVLLFIFHRKFILVKAFKSGKYNYVYLEDKSISFLAVMLFGSLFLVSVSSLVVIVYVLNRSI